jgi:hypothetical protein
VNGTRDDITVQPTPTGPGSFTSRIYGPGGQVLWTHYNSCRYGSPCGQPPMTGTATPVPPSPAATGATSAPTYSQSTINQANAVGTTPQNIVSLAQGHPGPGAPATFVEAKQTILPPGVHSSSPSGAHCSHGVRVTYLNGGNTGGTNGLAAGTQAWAYSCA